METFTLHDPWDMHLHLRDGEMLHKVAPYSASVFSGAVIMPNLNPPLGDVASVLAYRERILKATQDSAFIPYMTLYFHENLTREELKKAVDSGICMLKLYPKGVTTGSEAGVAEILTPKTLQILEWMSDLGLLLSIHGETNDFILEREFAFHPICEEIATLFPRLKIILEHLSDSRSLELLEKHGNLYGTLTLHHLLYTLEDLLGDRLNPHLFCKPVVKLPKDREALRQAAFSAHPKIAFGSDSAPHTKEAKESAKGAAGVFSAPILLPYLTELFEVHNALENLQAFLSDNAYKIYNLPRVGKQIVLKKSPLTIQESYDGVIPMASGTKIAWSRQF